MKKKEFLLIIFLRQQHRFKKSSHSIALPMRFHLVLIFIFK